MTLQKYLILACLPFILFSCDEQDFKLEIQNSTEFDLYVYDHDTSTLTDYPNKILEMETYFVGKGTKKSMGAFNVTWENVVKSSRNGGLNLFVIHADTVKKYDKDYIIKHEIYHQKLFFTLKELEAMKWLVEIK